ncbi:MAG: hypothetical protein KKC46_00495 [Proteobacteria bacterium]|nr:hypothetical protein [Pseudomonadota bacterium]
MQIKNYNCFFILITLLSVVICSGCAIADKDNRRTLNLLDDKIQIESTGGKITAAPVFMPVGTVAAITDMTIVHPLVSVPKAAEDTSEVIWENPQGSDFRQMMLLLPKVISTPLYFTGDMILRCFFSIN